MTKLKVIDLLNKIANGEEVPKKVKYDGVIFKNEDGDLLNDLDCSLFEHSGNEYEKLLPMLNDEIEILEEKKIPEKLDVISWDKCIHDVTHKEKELAIEINKTQELLNQVIDYLKRKGDE